MTARRSVFVRHIAHVTRMSLTGDDDEAFDVIATDAELEALEDDGYSVEVLGPYYPFDEAETGSSTPLSCRGGRDLMMAASIDEGGMTP